MRTRIVVCCSFASMLLVLPFASAVEKPVEKSAVQKVSVEVDAMAAAKLTGKTGVTEYATEKEASAALGEKIARQLTGKVDYMRDKLVFISWGTSGPPFGMLKSEIKGEAGKQEIIFFVEEPVVAARGQAYRLGTDFYSIPKDAKVGFRNK